MCAQHALLRNQNRLLLFKLFFFFYKIISTAFPFNIFTFLNKGKVVVRKGKLNVELQKFFLFVLVYQILIVTMKWSLN